MKKRVLAHTAGPSFVFCSLLTLGFFLLTPYMKLLRRDNRINMMLCLGLAIILFILFILSGNLDPYVSCWIRLAPASGPAAYGLGAGPETFSISFTMPYSSVIAFLNSDDGR
jgi:hypothetical protein